MNIMFRKKCLIKYLIFLLIGIGAINIILLLFNVKQTFKIPKLSAKADIPESIILLNITFNLKTSKPHLTESSSEIKQDATYYTEETFYRKRPYVVNKFIYDVLIVPTKPCPSNVDVVILVHNEHSKVEVRQAIRETWGSMALNNAHAATWPHYGPLKLKYSIFFIFGVSKDPGLNDMIFEENQAYGDIIQGNFLDSYKNMTLKSLLGLKYISKFCGAAKHLIKSDSDMFLNLPYLTQFLSDNALHRSILGPICVGAKVYRNGKWGIARSAFPFERYPTYEAGSAYIISRDLWEDMLQTSEYVPHIHIDDVYITGIIGRILNITHLVQPGFAYWTSRAYNVCDINQHKVFTITNLKPKDIKGIWQAIENTNCETSTKITKKSP